MSCCGGNCGCGANCGCGNSCGGCKLYPDLSYSEVTATTVATVVGVAPKMTFADGGESFECGADNVCKCSDNCTCNPCKC